jgi:hypothetical protein
MKGVGFVEILKPRREKEKLKEVDEIMQFSGIASGDTHNMSVKEIKEIKNDLVSQKDG